MPNWGRRTAAAIAVTVMGSGLIMAGCSADDVAFNGKVFDAVGMNGSKTKAAEPKMVARSPLVVPPGLDRLPAPGEQPESQASQTELAALNDPEKLDRLKKADLERQQAEYCKKNYEEPKLHGNYDVDEVEGPLGLCRATFSSVWDNFKKGNEVQEGQVEK
jgi:hypothetical protein